MKNLLRIAAVVVPYIVLMPLIDAFLGDTGISLGIAALGALIGPATGTATRAFGPSARDAAAPAADDLVKLLSSPFESFQIQKLLPPSLRSAFPTEGRRRSRSSIESGDITPFLNAGIQGIGQRAARPGLLSPQIAQALQAQFALASQGLAGTSRATAAKLANRLGATGAGSGAKATAGAAGLVGQERAQRGLRGKGLLQTGQLQRADQQQTFNLLDTILQFISSGRGQNIQGLRGAGQLAIGQQAFTNQQRAANIASLGSALSSIGGGK